MDSAKLYLELLDCGERLAIALTDARSADAIDTEELNYSTWQKRMRTAHHALQRAAECYAVALRTYRVAMLAELAPSDPVESRRSRAAAGRLRRARSMAAVCANGCGHANRSGRKDVGAEGFPASTTRSKIQ